MNRAHLPELHYITPIANVRSILSVGILSHRAAENVEHDSVAMPEVQDRRSPKTVPGGRPLHDYANLYFNARNPMMFRRQEAHAELCVLRVRTEVLNVPGVVVTDMNAARGIARFKPAPEGLAMIDQQLVFARDWRHPGDLVAYDRHRGIMCAEVLVPDRVDPAFILGAYVSCPESRETLRNLCPELGTDINGDLFFR